MRYRIIVEIDTDKSRDWVNEVFARRVFECVSQYSNPVYLATEVVTDKQRCMYLFWEQPGEPTC